eukprot:gene30567-35584_t
MKTRHQYLERARDTTLLDGRLAGSLSTQIWDLHGLWSCTGGCGDWGVSRGNFVRETRGIPINTIRAVGVTKPSLHVIKEESS